MFFMPSSSSFENSSYGPIFKDPYLAEFWSLSKFYNPTVIERCVVNFLLVVTDSYKLDID